MYSRRKLIGGATLGAALATGNGVVFGGIRSSTAARAIPSGSLTECLLESIQALPIDDSHCHPVGDHDAHTTADDFIERIALSAFPVAYYFPEGVYAQWKKGDAATRESLNQRYDIGNKRASVIRHFESSIFLKYMVKEMAAFLGCKATLHEVIEARNARGSDYFGYIHDLFLDGRIENVMVDTGYVDGLDAAGLSRFEDAIRPAKAHYLARVETITNALLPEDIPFPELRDRFVARVREALDGTGNFGRRSVGMKSYLLPDVGVIQPRYDDNEAAASWEEFKKSRQTTYTDRAEDQARGKVLRERLLTLALEECLARNLPMQFHAGDGEAPGVILRNQNPYYLEEVARFEKNGVLRTPKIIPIHAGYPLVSQAAWLSHLYDNVYFETSLMTPFIHQGLLHRYLEMMEAVPLSKILFGSDAYHVPELYWLAARWGKRYLAQALAVYVHEGILDEQEALQAARMMLHLNNRQVYGLE